jgi:hypothetical protein
VYLKKGEGGNPFFHHFPAKFGDNPVENSRLWWINCGQPVDNPLAALQKRVKREEKNETVEHKKREPINGSLVLNRIKYTLFFPKNQALAFPQVKWYRKGYTSLK